MTQLACNRRSRILAAVVLGTLIGCTGNDPYTQLFPNALITVNVSLSGTGEGTVESDDPNVSISCVRAGGGVSGTCNDEFDDAGQGGIFRLVATPAEASTAVVWAGCSSVAGPVCILTFGSTSGDTTFHTTATFGGPVNFGANLLLNPGFEASDVVLGGLPSSTGAWQGDLAGRVGSDQGISPRAPGSFMLKFNAAGLMASAGLYTSQQWQTVDLSDYAALIDGGKVRLDASAWVNRVAGDAETDTRFDLRVLAFPGTPAGFPADYPPPAGQIRSATVFSTAGSWQQLQVQFDVLPAGTRYVAVEIYPYEDVTDDSTLPEFDGHYADDVSLVLTALP